MTPNDIKIAMLEARIIDLQCELRALVANGSTDFYRQIVIDSHAASIRGEIDRIKFSVMSSPMFGKPFKSDGSPVCQRCFNANATMMTNADIYVCDDCYSKEDQTDENL